MELDTEIYKTIIKRFVNLQIKELTLLLQYNNKNNNNRKDPHKNVEIENKNVRLLFGHPLSTKGISDPIKARIELLFKFGPNV